MTWVVLLRGINVGGHRKVPMGELRDALANVGFEAPRTYIQSGNVVVDGGAGDERTVQCRVSEVILDRFGLRDVAVLVMGRSRLEHALSVSEHEFPIGGADPKLHRAMTHVVFLDGVPSPADGAALAPDDVAPDRFVLDIHDGFAELHISYADGAGSSKLTLDRVERSLGVRGTGRNLNTVVRLVTMVGS